MATLLNRSPTGRLVCLHALLQHLVDRYEQTSFTLRDAQYDINSRKTIHDHCLLLIKVRASRSPVCPFLQNPLNPAKCYLTQSLQRDTQKQKSVGDAINGLEALGVLDRVKREFVVNERGLRIADIDYYSEDYLKEMRECAISYGLFLGFLFLVYNLSVGSLVKKDEIEPKLGFPETADTLSIVTLSGKKRVPVSTGCKADTKTRTTGLLCRWAITLGYLSSKRNTDFANDPLIHVSTLDEIKKRILTARTFTASIPANIFENTIVTRPIEYTFLNPDPGARRDLPVEQRRASMMIDEKIKNRRLAIISALSSAFKRRKLLNFTAFKRVLRKKSIFVVDPKNYDYAMNLELGTAIIAGALWEVRSEKPTILKPLNKVDESQLKRGAPLATLRELNAILGNPSIYV